MTDEALAENFRKAFAIYSDALCALDDRNLALEVNEETPLSLEQMRSIQRATRLLMHAGREIVWNVIRRVEF